MPTQLELLAEANRRGILPPEKKPLFDEAVRRGLIQDNGSQPPQQSSIPDDTAPAPAATPAPQQTQTTVNPMVDRIIAAEEAKRGTPFTTAERIDMMANLNTQLQGSAAAPAPAAPRRVAPRQAPQQQAPQSGAGNFFNSAIASWADPLSNLLIRGVEATGLVSHERAEAARQFHPLPYDPERTSGVLGSAAGMGVQAVAAGPLAVPLMTAQMGEQAIEHVEDRVAAGHDISNTQAAIDVAGQSAIGAIMGKLAPGQAANKAIIKSLAPTLQNAVADSIKNVLISSGVHAGEGYIQNLASNIVTKYTGVDPNLSLNKGGGVAALQGAIMGGAGQAFHEIIGRGKTEGDEQTDTTAPSVDEGQPVPDGNVDNALPQGLPNVETPQVGVRGSDTESPRGTEGGTEVTPEQRVADIEQSYQRLNEARSEMKDGTTGDATKDAAIDTMAGEIQKKLGDYEAVAGEDAAEALRSRLEAPKTEEPAAPAKPSEMATAPGRPVEMAVGGQKVKGKYESVAMNGDHFVRAEDGRLHRVAPKDLRVIPDAELPAGQRKGLPKVPAGAREWSYSKLKDWAKENGYKVGTKHNLLAVRRAITNQRKESLITLPKPPGSSRNWTFKQYKYWAKQSGFDISNVKTRSELKRQIKQQRQSELATARAGEKPAKKSPITEDERTVLRRELADTKKKLAEEMDLRRTDPLTGAANLVAHTEDVARIFKDADAKNEHVAIAESDLGNFKVANDELGHDVGDKLLKAEAQAIREALRMPEQKGRPADYAGNIGYRIGGDEFPAILRNAADHETAMAPLRRASEIFDRKAAEIIGDRLPKEAYPFISWGVEIRKPGDSRPVAELRQIADANATANKSKIKVQRGVPETREGLQKFIEQRRAMAKRAVASAAKATPLPGTGHQRRVPRMLEELITPISSRIRDISPRAFDRVMRMEYATGRKREQLKRELHDPAARLTESLKGKEREFKRAVLNADFDAVYKMLPADRHADFNAFVKRAFPGLLEEMQKQGVPAGRIENFWPRFIKDHKAYDALFGDDKGRFEEAFDLARDIKGRRLLTAAEKTEIANSVIQGYGPQKIGSLGFPNARERSVETISDAQLDHYLDPFEAAFRYVDGATYAAERAKFMGKAKTPEQLPETMGRIVQEDIAGDKLDKAAQSELIDLLTTRFQADMLQMPKAARNFKQMVYLSTLGQFRSAITQITDTAITASQHGLSAAGSGIKKALRIGPAEKRFIMEEIGIHDHGEEFKDVGKIAKLTDTTLRWTGFKAMDRFGKESRINGAWDSMQAAAKDKSSTAFKEMEREYKPVFGEQWDATVADLAAGKKTENTRYLLFLDMAKVQPITMSQMPQKYLQMSSGRILYALKTFTITQLDMVRRDMIRDALTPGRRRVGLAKLGRYVFMLGLLGFGKDLLNDLIRGKKIDPDDVPARSVDALLATVGLNKYTMENAAKEPTKAAMNFLAPPLSWIDGTWKDITTGGMQKTAGHDDSQFAGLRTVRSLPVIGELLYFWSPLGRGFHMEEAKAKAEYSKKLAELRKEADIAEQEGDHDTAAFLIQVYNERRKNGPEGQPAAKIKPPLTTATVREGLYRKADRKRQQERKEMVK